MAINTKGVQGRREVHYRTPQEVLVDARQLAEAEHIETLGNWSPGQIFDHLAKAFDMAIDGADFRAFFLLRWFATLFLKRKFLERGLPPGLPTNECFVPEPIDNDAGLARLEDAIGRYLQDPRRGLHPIFGKLTPEEWTQFQLRHCEMHMSFLKVQQDVTAPATADV
ncbi:DUF1569 domain-containing protein [Bremerella sp. JC817]|uniref:DUF1569 domain-containing protein n=1 Tax=Bremerella sp. JC817 TaxID=3231756 RepID=UPI003457974C